MTGREAKEIVYDRCQHCKETEEALKVLKEGCEKYEQLLADMKERKTGKWHYYRCSECKCLCTYFLKGSYMIDVEKRPNYCPNCGAKMEVDDRT